MKKNDFFKQYHYDHELNAKLKQRQKTFVRYFKKTLIFNVLIAIIPLLFGKFGLAALLFVRMWFIFWFCGAIYCVTEVYLLLRPRCKKCRKRMLKKYISTGYGGEEQLYLYCPACRIYVDTDIRRG